MLFFCVPRLIDEVDTSGLCDIGEPGCGPKKDGRRASEDGYGAYDVYRIAAFINHWFSVDRLPRGASALGEKDGVAVLCANGQWLYGDARLACRVEPD